MKEHSRRMAVISRNDLGMIRRDKIDKEFYIGGYQMKDYDESREKIEREEYALNDVADMLKSDDDFSAVERHDDCVTAQYKGFMSEREYDLRVECCEADEIAGTYLLLIDFRCPRIKPEYRASVSEYVTCANEMFDYIYPYSKLVSREFGEVIMAQSCCSEAAQIPFRAHTLARIINSVEDDLICLASGRLLYDMLLFDHIRNRFEKILFNDLGKVLVSESEEDLITECRNARGDRLSDNKKSAAMQRPENESSDDEPFGRMTEEDDHEMDNDRFIEYPDNPADDFDYE